MKTVSIHDAKTNLSKYIAAAKRGETIYMGSNGKPEVKLVSNDGANSTKSGKRRFDLVKTHFYVAEDAFSEETDKEIADLMYGDDLNS